MNNRIWVNVKLSPEELEDLIHLAQIGVRISVTEETQTFRRGILEQLEDIRRNFFGKVTPPTLEDSKQTILDVVQDLINQLEEQKQLETVIGLRSLVVNVQGQLKALLLVEHNPGLPAMPWQDWVIATATNLRHWLEKALEEARQVNDRPSVHALYFAIRNLGDCIWQLKQPGTVIRDGEKIDT